MDGLVIRKIMGQKELNQVLSIRRRVFIREEKVPRPLEFDGLEGVSDHIIVLLRGRPIGCARVRFYEDKAKLERIALSKRYRGRGLGKQLLEYLIEYCKRKKAKKAVLNAQYRLRAFYKLAGFKSVGRPFSDAGMKHVQMIKDL
jgi:predicted GNAT family N-acyltransferase